MFCATGVLATGGMAPVTRRPRAVHSHQRARRRRRGLPRRISCPRIVPLAASSGSAPSASGGRMARTPSSSSLSLCQALGNAVVLCTALLPRGLDALRAAARAEGSSQAAGARPWTFLPTGMVARARADHWGKMVGGNGSNRLGAILNFVVEPLRSTARSACASPRARAPSACVAFSPAPSCTAPTLRSLATIRGPRRPTRGARMPTRRATRRLPLPTSATCSADPGYWLDVCRRRVRLRQRRAVLVHRREDAAESLWHRPGHGRSDDPAAGGLDPRRRPAHRRAERPLAAGVRALLLSGACGPSRDPAARRSPRVAASLPAEAAASRRWSRSASARGGAALAWTALPAMRPAACS